MSNGDRLPLLLFQEPVRATKPVGHFSPAKFIPRSRDEVAGYLGPKLTHLEQALEAERIRIQATGAGIEPELALVIELATEPSNFTAAARAISLEWLAEDEIDLEPSETICPINAKGQRQDKPFYGRLFLTMTDRRALDQLLSRWRQALRGNFPGDRRGSALFSAASRRRRVPPGLHAQRPRVRFRRDRHRAARTGKRDRVLPDRARLDPPTGRSRRR